MNEEKTINHGEALADYISEQDYGTIIFSQDIERITKQRYGTQRYYREIAKAKKILEDRGKMIQCIGEKSYQILYPGDYSGAYAREVKLAKKRIKHGGKIIKGAPVNDMTPEERQIFNTISDFHTRMEAQTIASYVEVKRLAGKRKNPLLVASTEQS